MEIVRGVMIETGDGRLFIPDALRASAGAALGSDSLEALVASLGGKPYGP